MTITRNYEMNGINQDNDHGTIEIEMGINQHNSIIFIYFIIMLNCYFYYGDSYHFICLL